MKTKHFFFFVMILLLSLSAFAQDRVVDNAGLLSAEQKVFLEERIASIAAGYNFDLVILTERSIEASDTGEYADSFFNNNGYGHGSNRDGSIFLQVTESRDYDFTAVGRGKGILNNTAFNKLEDDSVKFLGDGKYFEAYNVFIDNWVTFLTLDAKGRNYNFFYQRNGILVIISWALALLIGIYVVALWKSKMNTALAQTDADSYTVSNSLIYKEKSDRFLYSKVAKTKRQTQSSSVTSSKKSSSSSRSKSRSGKY